MGWEWEFRFRAPRQQHDGGLMMCDIFNSFPPHNHRPHSRLIKEGPFLPPPPHPHGRKRSHEERCIIQQPASRARRRGDRHRRARLIFTGPPGGGLLFAAASRRTRRSTHTDHAPLLAPHPHPRVSQPSAAIRTHHSPYLPQPRQAAASSVRDICPELLRLPAEEEERSPGFSAGRRGGRSRGEEN